MPRVILRHENGSEIINGVKFTFDRGEWVSEEISQEQADHFLSIPVYHSAEPAKAKPEKADKGSKAKAEKPDPEKVPDADPEKKPEPNAADEGGDDGFSDPT